MDDGGHSRRFKCIVSRLEIAPEAVPSVVRVPLEVDLGHTERKDVNGDRILTGEQGSFCQSIDLIHDGIRHGETTNRSTAAMDQYV
jgi:hypothetical protein